ncbi:MAG: hypothetical protein WA040_13985 [Anaerolineae bacterium]
MQTDIMRRMLRPLLSSRQFRDVIRFSESLQYHDLDVWNLDKGNRTILQALQSGMPQAIGKLGSTETQALRNYLRYRHAPDWQDKLRPYQHVLYTHSGVFPDNPETYLRFCEYMFADVLSQITVLGVWFNLQEASIVKAYAPNAKRIPIGAFETYGFTTNRWTALLAEKRVLVLHPFINTIRSQYKKRHQIWINQEDVLPSFELVQIAAPHYPALVAPQHADWFSALEDMQQQMAAVDFDVALIGAGAYSLPLAMHAKRLGKIGLHLGGALQLYFGITGGRWEANPVIQELVNESWVRPLPEDTPANNVLIEGGCYW